MKLDVNSSSKVYKWNLPKQNAASQNLISRSEEKEVTIFFNVCGLIENTIYVNLIYLDVFILNVG